MTSALPGRDVAVLALIIVALTTGLFLVPGGPPYGIDGSYYFQVARHVVEGDGLTTSVCLYHQGLKTLPAKTNIYPLWPLLLGFAGRLMPLATAAWLLPRLLFAVSLVPLFVLTARITNRRYVPFLVVALFGCNTIFFISCASPYTEPLAFALLFVSLLAVDRSAARAGVLAGFAFLTRSQMLLLVLAIPAAYALRRRWRDAAIAGATFVLAILPWVLYLATFVRPFHPSVLFSMQHATPEIAAYPLNGTFAPLRGAMMMFNPFSPLSFTASFGAAAFLVPLAALHAGWRRATLPAITPLAVLMSGVLLAGSLIALHQRFFLEWLFGYRHGLPFILLLLLALAEFGDHASATLRIVAVVLCVVSIATSMFRVAHIIRAAPALVPQAETELAAWLAQHDPNAIVLSTRAQELSAISRANFRWAACDDDPAAIRQIIRLVRTDYVAAFDGEQSCPMLRGLVGPDLEIITTLGVAPRRIFLMRVRAHASG